MIDRLRRTFCANCPVEPNGLVAPIVSAFIALALCLFSGVLFPAGNAYAADGSSPSSNRVSLQMVKSQGEVTEDGHMYFGGSWFGAPAFVNVEGYVSGDASYDAETNTLTLMSLRAREVFIEEGSALTIKLEGESSCTKTGWDPYYGGAFIVDTQTRSDDNAKCNITVTGSGTLKGGIKSKGDVIMRSGTIALSGNDCECGVKCSGDFTMDGGSIVVSKGGDAVQCEGNFLMKAGAIELTKSYHAVDFNRDFRMDGGTIKSTNSSSVIFCWEAATKKKPHTATITGGMLVCISPNGTGIDLRDANLTMTGGTIKVTDSRKDAISVEGEKCGGAIRVTGGSITAQVRSVGKYFAFSANDMYNNPDCLKSIKGGLTSGSRFKVAGNVYRVWGFPAVDLVEYGNASKTPKFRNVRFGAYTYYIFGVGSKAFNTPTGARVKTITFDYTFAHLGSYAFSGAKSLKVIYYKMKNFKELVRPNRKELVKGLFGDGVGKKAFKGCGKKNGAGFTFVFWHSKQGRLDMTLCRKLVTSKGMSKKSKLKQR